MLVEHPAKPSDLIFIDECEPVAVPWPLDDFMVQEGLKSTQPDDRRRFARKYYRRPIEIEQVGNLPAFPRQNQIIRTFCCDISRTGLAFLSDRELYPRETIYFHLEALARKKAVIVRCRRLAEKCFEVGGRFI